MSYDSVLYLLLVDFLIRGGLSVRVIMRRRPVGVTFAWLILLAALPVAGAVVYLTLGELRLGHRRALWSAQIHPAYQRYLRAIAARSEARPDWPAHDSWTLSRIIDKVFEIPTLDGNTLEILSDSGSIFQHLVADIDAARSTCHLVFYIWSEGGEADAVAEALIRAARRGVICRVLLDSVGSQAFLRSASARRMHEAGVRLHAALPGGLVHVLFVRFDLRMHRKIVVIDGEVAYTGSFNLVDPRFFKAEANVGQWIDAMVRVQGPVVEVLGLTFLESWELETDEGLQSLAETSDIHPVAWHGEAAVQVVPTGPLVHNEAMLALLLTALYSANHEIILTSPYFVPEEPIVQALVSAALRGVDVTLVIPHKVDSRLVHWASQAYSGLLVEMGVKVMLFDGGLLHTKSITIDGVTSLFGSLNLDPRSLFLNFEITLAVFDEPFTGELRQLQLEYIRQSVPFDFKAWQNRSLPRKLLHNSVRLLGPLL